MTREELDNFIFSVVSLRELATDAVASKAVAAYPGLHNSGKEVSVGTRINWNGELYRAAVTLFDNEQSTPDAAPVLWEKVPYKDGYRYIPEATTPGLVFNKGERGWWKDELYESTIDTNSWNPETYASAWKKVPLNV